MSAIAIEKQDTSRLSSLANLAEKCAVRSIGYNAPAHRSPRAVPTLDFRTPIDAPAAELFAWHARPGAFERLVPPWMNVALEHFEGIRDGDRAVLRLGLGPLFLRWVAVHRAYEEGHQFEDVQTKGPFRYWVHTHRMEPAGSAASVLHDRIAYELPLLGLGGMAEAQVRHAIERQFAYRHRITRQDLAAHRRNAGRPPLRIAISGASGLIGAPLRAFLRAGGHTVYRLVRERPADDDAIYWNHRTGAIERKKLEGLDAVIHLAGEPVLAPRWTRAKKRRILRSRLQGTALISETLAALDDPPDVFLSASGIGYYGDRGEERLTEDSPPGGRGFLTAVAHAWEAATQPAAAAGIRTVRLRMGAVLSPAGGALALMLPFFRLGLGASVGAKDQWISWIALDDVLQSCYHALFAEDLHGALNLTAPHPLRMRPFVRTLARVLKRTAPFHLPSSVLHLAMGEAATETALKSARVLPEGLQRSGYRFLYPTLEETLRHQLGYTRFPLHPAKSLPS